MSSFQAPPEDKFRHEALMYTGWAEFVAGTVPFIRDGIRAGEPVLVVDSVDSVEMLRIVVAAEHDTVLFGDLAVGAATRAAIIPP